MAATNEDFFSGLSKIDPTFSDQPVSLMDIDFEWVERSKSPRQMQEAVRLLENEGHFPDLLKAARTKLDELTKRSGHPEAVRNFKDDLRNWTEESKQQKNKGDAGKLSDLPPVRGQKGSKKQSRTTRLSSKERRTMAEREKLKGNEAFRAKDYDEAVQCYSKAIELNPSSSIFYSNRAQAYLKLDKHSLSEEDSSRALELDSKNVKALSRRGQARYYLKQFESALEDFTKSDTLSPGNTLNRRFMTNCQKEIKKQNKTPPKTTGKTPEKTNKDKISPGQNRQKTKTPHKKTTRVKIEETSTDSEEDDLPALEKINPLETSKDEPDDLPPLETLNLPKQQKRSEHVNKEEEYKEDEKEEKKETRALIFIEADAMKTDGNGHFKGGRIEQAIRCYERALGSVKDVLLRRGDITHENADNFEMSELAAPLCAKFHNNIALCYQQLEQDTEAAHHCSKAFSVVDQQANYEGISSRDLNNIKIKALMRRSLAFERMGEMTRAYDDLMHVRRIDHNIDKVSEKLPRLRKAAQEERNFLASQKKEEGNKFVKEKDSLRALKAYSEGLDLLKFDNPTYIRPADKSVVVSLLLNRALCHLNLKQFQEGVSDCSIVIEHFDDTNVKAYFRRGCAYKDLGDYEAAKLDILKTAEVNPDTQKNCDAQLQEIKRLEKLHGKQTPEPESTNPKPCKLESTPTPEPAAGKPNQSKSRQIHQSEPDSQKTTDAETAHNEPTQSSTPPRIQETNTDVSSESPEIRIEEKQNSEENGSTSETAESTENNEDSVEIQTGHAQIPSTPPKTHFEFIKIYNRIKSDSKLVHEYFKLISPSKLPSLFGDSLEDDCLSSIIAAIRQYGIKDSPGRSFSQLKYLTKTNRFDLNKMFMSGKDREMLAEIFNFFSKTRGFREKEVRKIRDQYT